MAVSVGVNNMSVVSKDSGGTTIAFPDVCKTPSPAGPIPIPYPNIAKSGSPNKAMQVWKYRHVLLCKHLILRHVLPEAIICNLLKLLTCTVLQGLPKVI